MADSNSALAELAPEQAPPPLWEDPSIGFVKPPETPVETSEAPKQPEIPPEQKKVENPPQVEEEVVLRGKVRDNFRAAEQAKKAAEERAAKIQKDLEDSQARIKEYEEKLAAVNPEEFTKKEQDYQAKLQAAQEQLQATQNELKFAALERDPEFIARYETPKIQLQEMMKSLAVAAGVEEKEFDNAIGNPKKMFELRDNLEPHEQYRWDAALSQIEQVNLQRSMALKNRDNTYQEINQRRQQAWEAQRNEITQKNLGVAQQVTREMVEKVPAFKDDPELQQRVSSMLEAIAGGKDAENWDTFKIMQRVAASEAQSKVLTTQHEIIQGQTAELEELKKKVAEQESFIKEKFGSLPDTQPDVDGKKAPEKPRPIWEIADETVRGNGVGNQFI